ncbi:MAG: MobF family relaxase [Acidimicrobiales bacterium]
MRATTLKASSAGLDGLLAYYAGLATRDGVARGPVDYYLDRNEPPGRWRGGGCAALGVGGEVRAEQLEALLTARHPAAGKRLGFGDRSARAFDATFSAPKSVSVLWALSPDGFVRAEVAAAHDAATAAALDGFEHHGALTRRGTDGVHQVDTQGLAVAVFRQHTSRAADPQLHSHAIVAAKVQDPTGRWLALDARFLKRQQRSIGWVYASALRAELTARLGLAWGPVADGHGDLAKVPAALVEEFSKRSEQVDAAWPSWWPPGSTPTTATSPAPAPCGAWSAGPCSRPARPRSRWATPRSSGPSGTAGPPLWAPTPWSCPPSRLSPARLRWTGRPSSPRRWPGWRPRGPPGLPPAPLSPCAGSVCAWLPAR